MIMDYSEAISKYKSDYKLKLAIKNKAIIKISKGVYSDKPVANELVSICKSYPNAIVTMDSAFYYYNLTDVIPQAVCLASVRDSYKIKSDHIKQTFQPIKVFGRGKVIIKTKEGIINIYSRERLLIELIRKRNSIPLDYYKEIINNYRLIKDDLEMDKIEEYALMFRNYDKIFDVIQKEVF